MTFHKQLYFVFQAFLFPIFIVVAGFSTQFRLQPTTDIRAIAASAFLPFICGSLWLLLRLSFRLAELTKERQDAQEARIKALEDALANENE